MVGTGDTLAIRPRASASVIISERGGAIVDAARYACQSRKEGSLVPEWYHLGMSKQIAVRLDDGLVEFVDEIVGSGRQPSRAAVVARALERERRRIVAEHDAEILAASGADPELVGLAEHAAGTPLDH